MMRTKRGPRTLRLVALLSLLAAALLGCARAPSVTRPVTPPVPIAMHRTEPAELDEELRAVPNARAYWVAPREGGARVYVADLGPRESSHPPLFLVHGIGDAGIRDFYPVLDAWSQTRRVIALDLPGFGHSERNDRALEPEGMVRVLASVLQALELERVDLLGHSSGSALALLLAAQCPERVRRLVVLGVCGVLRPETMLRSQLHESLNDVREKRPAASKLLEKSGDALVNAVATVLPSASSLADSGLVGRRPGVLLAAALLGYDFGPAIARVRAPTLIVWGEEDEVAPIRVGQLLDDRIPTSELVYVKKGGHVLMKDEPDALTELLTSYLNGPKPARPRPDKALASSAVAHCQDEADFRLSGDYERVVLDGCKGAWLNRVRARRIEIRDSDVRLDHTEVSDGVVAEDSRLVVTGGALRGDTALELSGGTSDLAGTLLVGRSAALRARDPAEILCSVTWVDSPKTRRFVHEPLELGGGETL